MAPLAEVEGGAVAQGVPGGGDALEPVAGVAELERGLDRVPERGARRLPAVLAITLEGLVALGRLSPTRDDLQASFGNAALDLRPVERRGDRASPGPGLTLVEIANRAREPWVPSPTLPERGVATAAAWSSPSR